MRLSPRNRLILIVLAVVIAIVALAVLLVLPQFGRLRALDVNINTADDQVQQAQSLLAKRQEAKDNAAFTDAALLQLAAAVPENPDLPSLIIELQNLAYENNVQIRRIEPGAELVQNAGFVTIPLEMEIWAPWTENVDFVQRLQKLTRQVRIVKTENGVLSDSDQEDALEALPDYAVRNVITLETYVIPAGAGSASGVPAPPSGQ